MLEHYSRETNFRLAAMVHSVIHVERVGDSKHYSQIVCVYRLQNGAEDKSLRNASGDGTYRRVRAINTPPEEATGKILLHEVDYRRGKSKFVEKVRTRLC